MALPFADGTGGRPDSWKELRFILIALGIGAVVVFAGSMLYVQQHPGAPWQLESVYNSAFSAADSDEIAADTTLRLPAADAEYLNRVYRDLNTRRGDGVGEVGFCVDLVAGRMSVQQAGTLEASEDSVRVSTANCLGEPEALLHFHPPYSRPELSGPGTSANPDQNDKQSLLDSRFQLSCVQAGLVTATPGTQPEAVNCYTRPGSGDIVDEFPEVPVVIGK